MKPIGCKCPHCESKRKLARAEARVAKKRAKARAEKRALKKMNGHALNGHAVLAKGRKGKGKGKGKGKA